MIFILTFSSRISVFFLCHTETLDDRLRVYTNMAEKFPKALAPRRLPLDFISGC